MSRLSSCKLLGIPDTSLILERPSIATGYGWELAIGHCHPVRHSLPALPMHLPEPELREDSEENESDEDNNDEEDNCIPQQCDDSSSSESSYVKSLDSSSDE